MSPPPTVLLTGASAGIGRATAELLACRGYRVFGTSRNPAAAPPIPGVTFLALDLQSPASVVSCVQRVLSEAGRIDILINNAGAIGPGSASEETDLQSVRALFEINFFGVVQVTNAVLPVMRCQKGGTIINISSTGGLISAPPFFSFYTATKHALEAYTEGLRYEVRPFQIRVAMVEPGYTSTGIGSTILPPDHPLPEYAGPRSRVTRIDRAGIRYGSPPITVARAILRILRQKQPALRNLTGTDSHWIVLANRILPGPLYERLIEWMYGSWGPPDPADHKQPDPADLAQPDPADQKQTDPADLTQPDPADQKQPDPADQKQPDPVNLGQPDLVEPILTPQELGLRRFLFHAPTRNLILRAAAVGGFALAGLAARMALRKRSGPA